jgi:hypothetical protein
MCHVYIFVCVCVFVVLYITKYILFIFFLSFFLSFFLHESVNTWRTGKTRPSDKNLYLYQENVLNVYVERVREKNIFIKVKQAQTIQT